MKSAIYQGKRDILLTELETPTAGDNDIVVRNLYASICGTDVAVYSHGPGTGHRITVGGEFGHTADVDIYIDAAGAESILELYQNMGKIESRIVVVAVLAGMRPVDILSMTFAQHACGKRENAAGLINLYIR